MSRELPQPWADELAPKGIHSYRDFASRIEGGISHETLRRLCTGGSTSAATVNRVADALFGGDATKVWKMYGEPLEDYGPWELPPEATLLNQEQRAAVLAVVKAMLPKPTAIGGDGNADTNAGGSASTSRRQLKRHEVDLAAYDEGGDA